MSTKCIVNESRAAGRKALASTICAIVPVIIGMLLLISSLPEVSADATVESFTETVVLQGGESVHQEEAIVNFYGPSSEITFRVSPAVEGFVASFDDALIQCDAKGLGSFTELRCPIPSGAEGRHYMRFSYKTSYPILSVGSRIAYISEYVPVNPTGELNIILKLPPGYVIPSEKDSSFFITPEPSSIYSDGQRIILLWEASNVSETYEISAMIEPLAAENTAVFASAGAIALFAAAGGVFAARRAKGKKGATFHALVENEEKVVDALKKSGKDYMWQKEIQVRTGLPKVKLSRLLRNLEERGIVKKEPWGNANRIILAGDPHFQHLQGDGQHLQKTGKEQ